VSGRPFTREQAIDAFRAKVDRSGGPDACWPWMGCRSRKGYGSVRFAGRTQWASHVALEIDGHPLEPGEQALHHCDNPPCCNPADRHLFAGTNTDNVADRHAKGRDARGPKRGIIARGEANGRARLTASDAASIRERASSESWSALARAFGVSKGAVQGILSGRTWIGPGA